jgi:hypothetical protein
MSRDHDAPAESAVTGGPGARLRTIVGAARCTGWPDLPWTGDSWRTTADEAAVMRAVCHTCPMIHACAAYADATDVGGGFWAGRFRDASAAPDLGGAA